MHTREEQATTQALVRGERNGETQFPALQPREKAIGAILTQADLNAGMSALVANQERWQETLQREGRHADANNSRVPASQGAGALAERIGVRQELPPASQEVFTFAR